MIQELLQQRRTALIKVVRNGADGLLHSKAWFSRIIDPLALGDILTSEQQRSIAAQSISYYGGIPQAATLGYAVGKAEQPDCTAVEAFLAGIMRLRQRPDSGQASLFTDELAILGLADGLSHLNPQENKDVEEGRTWLLSVINTTSANLEWSNRIRALAGDLLDQRGRLRVLTERTTIDVLALDLVLRTVWPSAFATSTLR